MSTDTFDRQIAMLFLKPLLEKKSFQWTKIDALSDVYFEYSVIHHHHSWNVQVSKFQFSDQTSCWEFSLNTIIENENIVCRMIPTSTKNPITSYKPVNM